MSHFTVHKAEGQEIESSLIILLANCFFTRNGRVRANGGGGVCVWGGAAHIVSVAVFSMFNHALLM